MVVHMLRFRDQATLTACVEKLLDSSVVEDCLVEADVLQLRFVAPPRAARSLVERLYLEGGLTWCSRHGFVARPVDRARPVQSLHPLSP